MSASFIATADIAPSARATTASRSPKVLNYRLLLIVAAGLGVAWIPSLLGRELIAEVTALHHLASSSPYFQVSHAWQLYALAPTVSISSMILFLTPGALIVLAFAKVRNELEWLLLSFACSLALTIALGLFAKTLFTTDLAARSHLLLWSGTAGLAWLYLAFRLAKGAEIPFPFGSACQVRRFVTMLAVAFVAVAVLTPKIFWENFNLDGIEAFEFGRSLTTNFLPRWEIQDGVFGLYHNFVLFAYPNHWFITLFGPFEASVRLPFILYLMVLFAGLILLIELGSPRPLTWLEESALWLGLALYTVVQTFNTNYEPFFADLAEMAATDTLVIALFLGSCYMLWTNRYAWFFGFAIMTCLAGPGAMLLFAPLAVGTFLLRPENWKTMLTTTIVLIAFWIVVSVCYELFYNRLVLDGINNQFSAKNMLRRLYPPTFTEFYRFSALIFPCGIIPLLTFFAVKRKDYQSLIIVGVTTSYFAVLYLQAWTSLHQFTPVMVLPILVFWRVYLRAPATKQRWLAPTLVVSVGVCLYLSLPQHFQINLATREFGEATEYRVGDYEKQYELAAMGAKSLSALLPEDYRMRYPQQPWGIDPLTWVYYATRPKSGSSRPNYFVQSSLEQAPAETKLLRNENGVSLYVIDVEIWRQHRERKLPRVVVSPLYEPILRSTYRFFREYVESTQQTAHAD